jgi:nitroreductase
MSATAQDLTEFLRTLRQVREYTSQPVSEDVINTLLEVARWSGSSANKQPIELVVVRDPSVKEKLGEWGAKPAATAAVNFLIVGKEGGFPADEGRLGERLMLAAHAHGLGAAFATLKEEGPDKAKELLGIPADRHVRIVISVSHIDQEARRNREKRPGPPRKPMSEFAHWERY